MNNDVNFIFDFDSTIVNSETLNDILALAIGNNTEKINEIDNITKMAMEGKISFRESLEKRLKLSIINKSMVDAIITKTLTSIVNNMDIVINNILKQNNTKVFIVSGGFTEVITPTAVKLNINTNNIYANKFKFNNNNEVIGVEDTLLLQSSGKAKIIQDLKNKGIINGKVIMIGDGYTDLETKLNNIVDEFICFCGVVSRKPIKEATKYVANSAEELNNIIMNNFL